MSAVAEKKAALPRWLFVLFVALLATATDEFVIAGVLPAVARDLGVSVAASGQLVTVFAVVYGLGAPTLAMACERYPRREVLVSGLAVFVAANVAAAMAPGFWWLMAARVVAALGAAVVASASFAMAAARAPRGEQGRYLGVVTAGMTTALFTGVPVGSWLGEAVGWRATFWLISGVGALAAVSLRVTAPHTPGGASVPPRERLRPLANTGVLRVVGVTFLAASGGLMFYTYLSAYVARIAPGRPGLLAFLLLVVGVAGLAGALLAGRIADAWGPHRSLRLVVGGHVLALMLASALIAGDGRSRLALTAVVAFWSLFAWGLTPPVQGSILSATDPASGMTAMALNISALYLGTGLAGAVGGAVISTGGVRYVPVAATLLMGLSFVWALVPAGASRPASRVSRPTG